MALTDNLVAYYKLDESSGNASDATGNGYTLTNTNSVTYSPALINNGANFGSANTNKSLRISSNLGITTGDITISMLVKNITEITSGLYVLGQQYSASLGYGIWYDYNSGSRRVDFLRRRMGVTDVELSSALTMGTSAFYHFVLTYTGGLMTGYINGSSIGSTSATGTGSGGTASFILGSDTSIFYSSSIIDEVGVWSRALTSTEVASLYNGGAGNSWPFGVNYSSTLTDSITLAASLLKNTNKVLIQSLTLTAILIRNLTLRILSEIVTLTATFTEARIYIRSLSDALTLTANIIRVVNKSLVNSLTLLSSFVRNAARLFTESITLSATEINNRAYLKTFTEIVSLTDSIIRSIVNYVKRSKPLVGRKVAGGQSGRENSVYAEGSKKEEGAVGRNYE